MSESFRIPSRHQPKGFRILYEDRDIIVGNKAAGVLAVSAPHEKIHTAHHALNQYVRKGNSRSHNRVFVVHRLDQDTSGVMVFAKTFEAQKFLKDNWAQNQKQYWAVVSGQLKEKQGEITSFLDDQEYVVHSTSDKIKGKLARTAYTVLKENKRFSLVEIDLLTGKRNQIRVHFAEKGHPLVGDHKYGQPGTKFRQLALHAKSITLTHPFSKERLTFTAPVPEYFASLMGEPLK